MAQLAEIARDHELIVTHGNGPQVGLLALESVNDVSLPKPYPLDVIGAQTQGMIGYWLLQGFTNVVAGRPVVALVTQTVVKSDDPAFGKPTKFVGAGYPEPEARQLATENSWTFARDGVLWRRTVASPEPQLVVEMSTIASLVSAGATVICAGGGGVPVVRDEAGQLQGVEAVIDKDLTSGLIARELRADVLLLLTDVEGIFADFSTPSQRLMRDPTVAQLRAMSFSAGSMGPKIEAACRFVTSTGMRAAIGSLDDARGLLQGSSGSSVSRRA